MNHHPSPPEGDGPPDMWGPVIAALLAAGATRAEDADEVETTTETKRWDEFEMTPEQWETSKAANVTVMPAMFVGDAGQVTLSIRPIRQPQRRSTTSACRDRRPRRAARRSSTTSAAAKSGDDPPSPEDDPPRPLAAAVGREDDSGPYPQVTIPAGWTPVQVVWYVGRLLLSESRTHWHLAALHERRGDVLAFRSDRRAS